MLERVTHTVGRLALVDLVVVEDDALEVREFYAVGGRADVLVLADTNPCSGSCATCQLETFAVVVWIAAGLGP